MRGKHIDFSSIEPGDSVDEGHLAQCESCRTRQRAMEFVRLQAQKAPRIEAPPFFASRVAALAAETPAGREFFSVLLQRAARQLLPIFATLILTVSFLTYRSIDSSFEAIPAEDSLLAELLEEDSDPEELTLDEVVSTLIEGPAFDDQQQ